MAAFFVVPVPEAHARPGCHSNACEVRVAAKHARWDAKWCARHQACRYRVFRKRTIAPYRAWLAKTGACESGTGSYDLRVGLRAYNPSPFYGRYQFVMSTWYSVGGRGDPRDADWLEQAYRAVLLLRRSGAGQWPVCGH